MLFGLESGLLRGKKIVKESGLIEASVVTAECVARMGILLYQ